jgi:heme oxygenase
MPDGAIPPPDEVAPPGGARMALRAATAAAHVRLHHLPALAPLAEGTITRAAYVAMLRRLLGFHLAVERCVAAGPSVRAFGVDIAERRRSPLLLADLATLGAPAEVDAAPDLPISGSAAGVLGCLYVVEGSTLGGRELARHLDHLLPAGSDAGRAFLLGHGARHGAMWRAFCVALEACGTDAGRRADMVEAALATFAAFESWFTLPAPGG